MIRHTYNPLWPQTADSSLAQALESLRTGYLVAIQAVDIKLVETTLHVLDDVSVPNFIKKCVHTSQILLIQST